MTRDEFLEYMDWIYDAKLKPLWEEGQHEYGSEHDVFANFRQDARELDVSIEKALLIQANKQWRGIRAWARGHQSQRESVEGRIDDALVYLFLLRGLVERSE